MGESYGRACELACGSCGRARRGGEYPSTLASTLWQAISRLSFKNVTRNLCQMPPGKLLSRDAIEENELLTCSYHERYNSY
jgi:hypothetical protein